MTIQYYKRKIEDYIPVPQERVKMSVMVIAMMVFAVLDIHLRNIQVSSPGKAKTALLFPQKTVKMMRMVTCDSDSGYSLH